MDPYQNGQQPGNQLPDNGQNTFSSADQQVHESELQSRQQFTEQTGLRDPFTPNVPQGPPPETVQQQPVISGQSVGPQQPKKSSSKGPLIAAGIGVFIVIVLTVVGLMMSGGNSSKTQKQTAQPANTTPQLLQPGQAIDVEQANNAINQDLSTLNDDNDFPDSSLEDKTIGL